MLPGYVVPGQLICTKDAPYEPGSGVQSTSRGLVATVLGKVVVDKESTKDDKSKATSVSVINAFQNPYVNHSPRTNSRRSISQLPQVGDVVYGHVLRLGQEQVNLDIVAVEGRGNMNADVGVGSQSSALGSVHPPNTRSSELNELDEGYGAVIRIQDIRATERDKIKIQNCYRPGDVVRASVLTIGDGQNYYLTTARSDLGVIFARDPLTGDQLVPIDWQNVINPATGISTPRKCANPFVS